MNAHLSRRIRERQAGGSSQRNEGRRQDVESRSYDRWISLGACTLQIDRIGKRVLVNQCRLRLRSLLAECRGNTGGDDARNETNTRGDPAHSNQKPLAELRDFFLRHSKLRPRRQPPHAQSGWGPAAARPGPPRSCHRGTQAAPAATSPTAAAAHRQDLAPATH